MRKNLKDKFQIFLKNTRAKEVRSNDFLEFLEDENFQKTHKFIQLENGNYVFFINGEINEQIQIDFISTIYQINALHQDNEEVPILFLYINSFGGDVDSELQIIDQIEQSVLPVVQYATLAMSQQQMIFISQDYRIASPNAFFYFHDFHINVEGKYSDIIQRTTLFDNIKRITRKQILQRTFLTEEEVENIFSGKDYYFTQTEQLKKGIADLIGRFNGYYVLKVAEIDPETKEIKYFANDLPEKSVFLNVYFSDSANSNEELENLTKIYETSQKRNTSSKKRREKTEKR